jgi:hypothetical protein
MRPVPDPTLASALNEAQRSIALHARLAAKLLPRRDTVPEALVVELFDLLKHVLVVAKVRTDSHCAITDGRASACAQWARQPCMIRYSWSVRSPLLCAAS